MEGNGRAARIWLDMLLKKRLGKCVDWRLVAKKEYLAAMKKSVVDSSRIHALIAAAPTDDIDSRQLFMKGIDYSCYYEVVDGQKPFQDGSRVFKRAVLKERSSFCICSFLQSVAGETMRIKDWALLEHARQDVG